MKITGSSRPPVSATKTKKYTNKKSISTQSGSDSNIKITSSKIEQDETQSLINEYIESLAKRKFPNFYDSSLLATAIKVVSEKFKNSKEVAKLIKRTKK